MSDSYLSDEQVAQLLRQINPARVQKKDNASHLEAYDVRAMLIRIFGFGRFSADLIALEPLFETLFTNDRGDRVTVGYRATLRLTVCAPDGSILATYTEAATGDASNFPISKRADAHDFAIKTAESQALKRCATNLGDQFGLSLYRKGSTHALVVRTLVGQPAAPEGTKTGAAVDEGTPQIVPEHPESEPEVPPMTSSPVDPLPGVEENAAPSPDSPVQDSPPEPVDPQVAVGALREQVIELLKPPVNRREALQKLTRLQIQAGKDRLMEQETHSPLGEPCTVQMLLDGALKLIARREEAA